MLAPTPVRNLDEVTGITEEIKKGKVKIPPGHFEISVISWRNKFRFPGLENFGGTIVYRKLFQTEGGQTRLDLGKVAETAEVTLNGKDLGVKWWGEKTFDISRTLKKGENELEIKVTTLLWNYCNSKTMEENPMAKLWANSNRDKTNRPLPIGLIGPVVIF